MRIEQGDGWTLYNADCLDVLPMLTGVDAVITDPPYCSGGRQQQGARLQISKNDSRGDGDWFLGDNMGTDTYLWFMRQIASRAFDACTDGSPAYIFTDWRQYTTVVTAWESIGWTLRTVIVWDKDRGGAMGSWWRSNHEWVAVFAKGKPRPLAHASFFNTWRGSKPQGGEHPTEKPLNLLRYIVQSVTPGGGLICDPFAGSGTTGVAALTQGYDFVGVERNPLYFDIACRRIEAAAMQQRLDLAEG